MEACTSAATGELSGAAFVSFAAFAAFVSFGSSASFAQPVRSRATRSARDGTDGVLIMSAAVVVGCAGEEEGCPDGASEFVVESGGRTAVYRGCEVTRQLRETGT